MNKIIGQDRALEFISSALKSERLSGAYLFAGPDGVGKYTVARMTAAALLCSERTFPSCGECVSCRKVEHFNHPDVLYLEPRGAEIRIDDVREMNRIINLKAFEGKNKVAIVDNAVKMRREAANAMLKTLEEPPPDTIIILIATSTAALLPTIVSRSQIIRFSSIEQNLLADWLVANHGIEAQDAEFLARFSAGSLGRAAVMLKKKKVADIREHIEKLAVALEGGVQTQLEVAEEIADKRDSFAENIEFLLMICNLKMNEAATDEERTLWVKRTETVMATSRKLKFNPSMRLAAEAMFFNMP